MNILLIEDDELTLSSLSFQLIQLGHTVHGANNGRMAVDIVLDKQVDIVVCDLMLPVISGVSFLRIRRKFMSPHIPVIAISSLENAEELLQEMGVDFGFFIKKPVPFEKLLEAINQSQLLPKKEESRATFYI